MIRFQFPRAVYKHHRIPLPKLRFREKGKMPNRGKNSIFIKQVAEEAAEHMGWDKDLLVRAVVSHQKDLSTVVHGGREVLGVYTQREVWGDIEVPWDELGHHADPPMTKDAVAGRIRRLLAMADKVAVEQGIPGTDANLPPDYDDA